MTCIAKQCVMGPTSPPPEPDLSLTDVVALIPNDARVIAVAGAVAAGKSTLSSNLAALLVDRGTVTVVSTDGFLLSNLTLGQRGLLERKGFPESYNVAALQRFVTAVRENQPTISVPKYSHSLFDVVEGATITAPDVVIIEGVNALQPDVAALADVCIYLDAPDDAIIGWFTTRFVELTDEARRSHQGFYVRFASLGHQEVQAMARNVWDSINGPNLQEHIRPTMAHATIVVTKRLDHSIESIRQGSTRCA